MSRPVDHAALPVIRRHQAGWVVTLRGVKIAGPYGAKATAVVKLAALTGGALAGEEAPGHAAKRLRPCITCREEFASDGAHNRMCPRCRWHHRDDGAYRLHVPRRSQRRPA